MSQKESQGQPLAQPARVDWGRLDTLERTRQQGSSHGRENRQQLLERKRQNNFVRRREFAHLRKLRQNAQKNHGLAGANGTSSTLRQGLSSTFSRLQSSSLKSRLTAPTVQQPPKSMLEQIDAIEAQISQQWFEAETKVADAPRAATPKPAPAHARMPQVPPGAIPPLNNIPLLRDALPSEGSSLPAPPAMPPPPSPPLSMDELMGGINGGDELPTGGALPSLQDLFKLEKPWDGVVTRPGQPTIAAPQPPAPQTAPAAAPVQAVADPQVAPPSFLATPPPPAQPPDFAHYAPFLYEAAGHFAHNNLPQAESCLRALLVLHKAAAPGIQLQLWLALVQLYRASNHAQAFEHVALELARRFGRSPPQWFAMLQERLIATDAARPAGFRWQAPAHLDAAAIQGLAQAWGQQSSPWTLDWGQLAAVPVDVAQPLVDLLQQWVQAEGHFVLLHVQNLLGLLQQHSPSGEAGADTAWWQARMLLLRMLGDQEEFDSAALDYCVTYEVSPPWWEPTAGTCAQQEEKAAGGTLQPPQAWQQLQWAGIVEGDVSAWLHQLPMPENGPLMLDCSQLTRMDEAAARALLRWLQDLYAKGQSVQLQHLHLLLAAFLHQHGVGQYAHIAARSE